MDGMGFSNVSALETFSWKDPILILTSCFCNSSERFSKFPSAEWPKSIKNEVFVGSKKWNTISPLIGDYFCGRETLFL